MTRKIIWCCAAHLTEVFGTSDGGRTWTESVPVKAPAPASLLSFADSRDGWLLASDGGAMGRDPVWLYRTTDAGRRWSLITGTGIPAGCDKAGLVFAATQAGWLSSACALGSPDVLLVTRDGGTRWTPQPLPVPAGGSASASAPQFFGRTGFLVLGAAHFLASQDLGRTWTPRPLPPGAGAFPRITFFGPKDGILVPAGPSGAIGGVFDTTADGGVTWTAVRQGMSFAALGTEVDFVSPRTGFAWVQGSDAPGGPPPIHLTADSGRTWTAFTPVMG